MELGRGYAARLFSHQPLTESRTSLHLEGIFVTASFQNRLVVDGKLMAQPRDLSQRM